MITHWLAYGAVAVVSFILGWLVAPEDSSPCRDWDVIPAPLPSGMRYSDGLRILQHAVVYLRDRGRLYNWGGFGTNDVLTQARCDVIDALQAQARGRDRLKVALERQGKSINDDDIMVPAVTVPNVCAVPPAGWSCTREPGHAGPCAAWPAAAHLNQDGEVD